MEKGVIVFWEMVLALVCLFFGALVGSVYTENDMQIQAVAHGVAHYVIDPQTGKTKVEWVNKVEGE